MVLDRLFRRKKKEKGLQISRSAFLKAKPVRNPMVKWVKNRKTKEVKITIPLQRPSQTGRQKSFLSKLFPPPPKEKIVNLDKVGSVVWELCDGERTVGDIAKYLVDKYKIMPEEAEISLNAYFNQLSKRGLVGFILPKELREKEEEKNISQSSPEE